MMNYRVEAICAIVIAILGFAGATRLYLHNRPRASLIVLLLTSLFLKCFSASSDYLHPWDERYHALVAKHLIDHPLTPTLYEDSVLPYNHVDWETNHIWLHKPPLTLWLIALSLKLFGIVPFAVRIPSILLSTLAIVLTWEIARRLFDTRIAFLAALFHALCGILIAQTAGSFSTDHVDTIFIFFIELGVYFAVLHRVKLQWRYVLLTGLAIGLALLTKWAAALVVLPVWLALIWNRHIWWKTAIAGFLMLTIAAAIAAPWQLYIHHTFPTEAAIESKYNWEHLFFPVEEQGNGPLYHFGKAYELFGVLFYPGMIIAIILFYRRRLPAGAGPLLLWCAITYTVFTAAATKMGGYVLIAVPAVFILLALVLNHLQKEAERSKETKAWSAILFLLFAISAGVPIIQRMNLFNGVLPVPPWATALRNAERRIPPGRIIVFNDPHPIETMFDTGAIVYPNRPTDDDIKFAASAGYQICILNEEGYNAPQPDNAMIIDASPALWQR